MQPFRTLEGALLKTCDLNFDDMAAAAHVYSISGISGEFLKDHDLIGKQDPYVIFEHGHQKVETSVSKSRLTLMPSPRLALSSEQTVRVRTPFRCLAALQSKVPV